MVSESLGIIEPQFFKFEGDFELESGKILEGNGVSISLKNENLVFKNN